MNAPFLGRGQHHRLNIKHQIRNKQKKVRSTVLIIENILSNIRQHRHWSLCPCSIDALTSQIQAMLYYVPRCLTEEVLRCYSVIVLDNNIMPLLYLINLKTVFITWINFILHQYFLINRALEVEPWSPTDFLSQCGFFFFKSEISESVYHIKTFFFVFCARVCKFIQGQGERLLVYFMPSFPHRSWPLG